MSEVQPALTPEEWAEFPDSYLVRLRGHPSAELLLVPRYFPTRHGIAAMNLVSEPFGFRPEDMELLIEAVRCAHNVGQTSVEMRLRNLSDRIAALLPPSNT